MGVRSGNRHLLRFEACEAYGSLLFVPHREGLQNCIAPIDPSKDHLVLKDTQTHSQPKTELVEFRSKLPKFEVDAFIQPDFFLCSSCAELVHLHCCRWPPLTARLLCTCRAHTPQTRSAHRSVAIRCCLQLFALTLTSTEFLLDAPLCIGALLRASRRVPQRQSVHESKMDSG